MEMLMQSYEGYIHLLPALPKAWSEGSFRGMKAPGNITVNAAWSGGRITRVEFRTPVAQPVDMLVNGVRHTAELPAGKPLILSF